MMKVMMVSEIAPPYIGGGESYTIQLGTNLIRLGHEVRWLTSRIPGTNAYENYDGISMHRIPILFAKKYFFPGRQTFPITALIQKLDKIMNDVDVVEVNSLVAGYTGWRLARKYKKRSLFFCHEFYGELWNRIGQNYIERTIYPKIEKKIATAGYDWFACPSEYSKSTLIKAGTLEQTISVIPHGINHELFNTHADGQLFRKKFGLENNRLFGFIGRLRVKKTAQSKNLIMLLKAASIVCKQLKDAKLVLAGAGFEELEPFVRKMDLQDSIFYAGDIPFTDNPKFLRMCDVVVCPALSDGFCFMLAEASACGRPVVATNVGSHPDRVVRDRNGLLVEPTEESLAEGIVQLLSDRTMMDAYGNAGSVYSQQFTWENSVRKHLELYQKLV